eukprot:9386836-Heterocapsa_arctica.AAC.1
MRSSCVVVGIVRSSTPPLSWSRPWLHRPPPTACSQTRSHWKSSDNPTSSPPTSSVHPTSSPTAQSS